MAGTCSNHRRQPRISRSQASQAVQFKKCGPEFWQQSPPPNVFPFVSLFNIRTCQYYTNLQSVTAHSAEFTHTTHTQRFLFCIPDLDVASPSLEHRLSTYICPGRARFHSPTAVAHAWLSFHTFESVTYRHPRIEAQVSAQALVSGLGQSHTCRGWLDRCLGRNTAM